jgi:hypothetical protein
MTNEQAAAVSPKKYVEASRWCEFVRHVGSRHTLTLLALFGALSLAACGSTASSDSGATTGGSASGAAGAVGVAGAGAGTAAITQQGDGGSPAQGGSGASSGGASGSVALGGSGGTSVTAGAGGMLATGGDDGQPDPNFETKFPPDMRRMLIRDEGNSSLHYVNLANPAENWVVKTTSWARGMQLVGNNVVLGGREDGYEEYDLKTGAILKQVKTFPKTQSAYRMPNGETMLAQDGGDTTLSFLEPQTDVVKHKITYAGYSYIRMVRPTPQGTYLLPADQNLAEGDADGKILWTLHQPGWMHIWEALRLPDQRIVLGSAFGATLDFLDPTTHMIVTSFGGKNMPDAATIQPNFFAEYQILPNGNFITSNWQGHGGTNGAKGLQIVEFDPTGKVVWTYKQDPAVYSSIQGVMVLDGLDPQVLHIESVNGMWTPVK